MQQIENVGNSKRANQWFQEVGKMFLPVIAVMLVGDVIKRVAALSLGFLTAIWAALLVARVYYIGTGGRLFGDSIEPTVCIAFLFVVSLGAITTMFCPFEWGKEEPNYEAGSENEKTFMDDVIKIGSWILWIVLMAIDMALFATPIIAHVVSSRFLDGKHDMHYWSFLIWAFVLISGWISLKIKAAGEDGCDDGYSSPKGGSESW